MAAHQVDPIPEALYEELQSPSLFGRLFRIASFLGASTGGSESGDAARLPTPEIESALRKLHLEVFRSWLTLSLQRQKADISIYLNSRAAGYRSARIQQLAAMGEHSIPPDAKLPERQLFLQDLKIIQLLFNYDQ